MSTPGVGRFAGFKNLVADEAVQVPGGWLPAQPLVEHLRPAMDVEDQRVLLVGIKAVRLDQEDMDPAVANLGPQLLGRSETPSCYDVFSAAPIAMAQSIRKKGACHEIQVMFGRRRVSGLDDTDHPLPRLLDHGRESRPHCLSRLDQDSVSNAVPSRS